ncbi:hypothetical protein HV108_26140 (plasmid) [Escherichia coli]|nr:hypothetical protein HV108_26140 [Escherichia coli]
MVQKKKNKKSTKTNTIEIKKNNDRKEGEQQPLIGFHEGYRYIKLMLCPCGHARSTQKSNKNYSEQNASGSPFLKGFFLFIAACNAGAFRTAPAGFVPPSLPTPGHDIPAPCVHVLRAAPPVHSQRQPRNR